MTTRRRLSTTLAAAAGLILVELGSAAAAGLVPHRAFYALSLDSIAPGSALTEIRGALFVEWVEGCEGWSSSQRFKLRVFDTAKPMVEQETRFASWEANDGLTYSFNMQSLRQGVVNRELRGRAALRGEGMSGTAEFTLPEGLRFDLPEGTMFPLVHLKEVIDAASAGEKVVSRVVFDGTNEQGPFEINAVIGPRRPPQDDMERLPASVRAPSWPMRLAFFQHESKEALPFYEMTVQLLENGLAENFLLDFEDSIIRAELDRIEVLERPSC
jgi:hypothetical protein